MSTDSTPTPRLTGQWQPFRDEAYRLSEILMDLATREDPRVDDSDPLRGKIRLYLRDVMVEHAKRFSRWTDRDAVIGAEQKIQERMSFAAFCEAVKAEIGEEEYNRKSPSKLPSELHVITRLRSHR